MIQFLRTIFGRTSISPVNKKGEEYAPLSQKIRWVAEVIADVPEFERRASSVAKNIGEYELAGMEAQIHAESVPPEHLQQQFPGLGQWLAARQFAIFEILFYVGSPALPLVKKVAFGPYDWSQGNAIEVLCRLAAQDPDQQEIVSSLVSAAPTFREEALAYALGPLKQRAVNDGDLQKIIEQLIVQQEFYEAYHDIPLA